jgi:hypothetical protein
VTGVYFRRALAGAKCIKTVRIVQSIELILGSVAVKVHAADLE